jgi:hypothetical protein
MLPFDSKEFMKALPTWLRRDSPLLNCMNAAKQLALLVVLFSVQALGQARPGTASIKTPASEAQPWEYTLTVDGFIVPDGTSYVDPVLTADHRWLHLEARYNEESLRTASLWVGYNLSHSDVSAGDNWEVDITPMIGTGFDRLQQVAGSLVRDADIHVSQSQEENARSLGELGRARVSLIRIQGLRTSASRRMVPASDAGPDIHLLSRAQREPSQMIEFGFAASPETIRNEPPE